MELKTTKLIDIIQNTQVFYSTKYSGEFKAPADLLELILENDGSGEALNLGLMFFKKQENGSLLVVDGLKRLITVSLLLYAICECYKLTNEQNARAIDLTKRRYLYNGRKLKIQLSDEWEKYIYETLVNHEKMTANEKQHPMFITLHEFWAKIKMSNLSATKLFSQIKQIEVISYIYDESELGTRDLYKMLNYNHENIEDLQLITDFIEEKSEDGLSYWYDIVRMFKDADMVRKFRYFLIDFLTLQKNGIIPKENELYTSFKKYFLKNVHNYNNLVSLFKSLKENAANYIMISTANFDNELIKQRIKTIKETNMYQTFPYLLEVTDDYVNGVITEETFCQLLDTVILFITEQRNNNFESTINFGTLSTEIGKRMLED